MKIVFAILLLLCSPMVRAQKAELFVLAVGIEKYQESRLNLNFCADDARDIGEVFQKQTDLYSVMEVKVLTDEQATRSAIRSELDRFGKMMTGNDLFVFFFSGHGMEDGLVAFDFNPNDPYAILLGKPDVLDYSHGFRLVRID